MEQVEQTSVALVLILTHIWIVHFCSGFAGFCYACMEQYCRDCANVILR